MLAGVSFGAACGATPATNDGGSTRSSSEGDAYAADATARWKRSVAATWLGDWEPGAGAPPSDEDPEGAALCDAIESAPLPEGLLDGDVDAREAGLFAVSSAAETAEFCRRHRELMQRGEQGAAWNPFVEPWEPSWQQRATTAAPLAQAGPPWEPPNGADAAAGTAAVWNADSQDVRARERRSETATRFCVWCGAQVPPNLVQAKFCIFCGRAHAGPTGDAVPGAPAQGCEAPSPGMDGAVDSTAPASTRRPERSGTAGTPAAVPWQGGWGCGDEAETLGGLADKKWNAMTAGERILALVKTRTSAKVDAAFKLQ